jgi:corrinoid protein of di/trimethylamine methyltransferase
MYTCVGRFLVDVHLLAVSITKGCELVVGEEIEALKNAVIEGDADAVSSLAQKAVDAGIDPIEILEKGISDGAQTVGEQFENMEIFLTELMLSGEAMMAGLDVVLPQLKSEDIPQRGKVVVGTVRGDVHEIGKNIFKSLLIANGFEVSDIGVDVPTSKFVEEAEKIKADIIAVSALMTSTLGGQKDVIDYLEQTGDRDKYIVMVGGGPTNQVWADEIGADGFAETAPEAVRVATKLIEERRG